MVLQEELRDKADKIFAPVVGKSPAHKKAKEGNYDNIEMNKIPAMPGAGNTAKTGNKDGKEAVEEEDEDMGIKEEVAVAGEEAAAAAAAATPLATASAATARASNEVRTPQQLQQLQQQHQQSSTKQLLLEKITVYLAASLERTQIKANSSTLYTTGWPWSWSPEQREQAVFAIMKELGRDGRDLQDVSTFSDQGWNASATTLRFRSASVTTSILTAIAGDNKNGNPWREGGRNIVTMREETFMEADRKIVAQAVQQIIAGGTRGYGLHLDRKTGDYILMQEGTVLAAIEFYESFVTATKTLKRFLSAFERSLQGEIIKRTPAAPWSFKLVEMEAQELQKFEGGTMNTNSAKGRRSPAKGKGNGKGKSKDKTDMNERGGKGKGGKAWVARTAARARTRARTTSTHRA